LWGDPTEDQPPPFALRNAQFLTGAHGYGANGSQDFETVISDVVARHNAAAEAQAARATGVGQVIYGGEGGLDKSYTYLTFDPQASTGANSQWVSAQNRATDALYASGAGDIREFVDGGVANPIFVAPQDVAPLAPVAVDLGPLHMQVADGAVLQAQNDAQVIAGSYNKFGAAWGSALSGNWSQAWFHLNYTPSEAAKQAVYDRVFPQTNPALVRLDATAGGPIGAAFVMATRNSSGRDQYYAAKLGAGLDDTIVAFGAAYGERTAYRQMAYTGAVGRPNVVTEEFPGLAEAMTLPPSPKFASTDELVPQLATAIEFLMPGKVEGVGIPISRTDPLTGKTQSSDADIKLTNGLVIEVKSGTAQTAQVLKQRDIIGSSGEVVVYGPSPKLQSSVIQSLRDSGIKVFISASDLMNYIKTGKY
jgi:hypothetical protein